MKMIKCYIREEKLDVVRKKFFELGIPGLSVKEARGIGKPLSQLRSGAGGKDLEVPQFRPRVEISVVLEDKGVEELVDVLVKVVQTGKLGDGKIFILPVDDAIRIRTGERGEQALY